MWIYYSEQFFEPKNRSRFRKVSRTLRTSVYLWKIDSITLFHNIYQLKERNNLYFWYGSGFFPGLKSCDMKFTWNSARAVENFAVARKMARLLIFGEKTARYLPISFVLFDSPLKVNAAAVALQWGRRLWWWELRIDGSRTRTVERLNDTARLQRLTSDLDDVNHAFLCPSV